MTIKSTNLPIDWQVKLIREVYRFTKKPRSLSFADDGSILFIPMEAIPIGRVYVSGFEERPAAELTSGTHFEDGDLLVAKITPSFENGKQAIADLKRPFGYATTEVIPIQEIEGVSDKHFLFHLLLHPEIRSDLAGKMDGTTGRQRLSKEVLGDCVIPVPPLSEQRKIAGVLGVVQRAVEQQEGLLQLTTELKKALLHQLFTQGLRGEPQKQTEIGPVPESWETLEMGKAVNLFCGFAFKSKEAIASSNTQLIRMGNLFQNKLDLTRSPIFYPDEYALSYSRFVLKAGDLIMSLTGTTGKEDYGFTVKIKEENRTLLLNQRIARIENNTEKIDNDYLHYFLLSRRYLDQLYPTAKGMKQANLSTYAMKKLIVLIPEQEEQREIANYFRMIDQKIELHEKIGGRLQALFRTLLHQLMTAEIRVNSLTWRI